MAVYQYNVPVGNTGNTFAATVDFSEVGAYTDEEYLRNPAIIFYYKAHNAYGNWYLGSKCFSVARSQAGTTYGGRYGMSIENMTTGIIRTFASPDLSVKGAVFNEQYGQKQAVNPYDGYDDIEYVTHEATELPFGVLVPNDYRINIIDELYIATNIPIFETSAELQEYIQYGDNIEDAINNRIPSVSGRDFGITNIWTTGTWTATGYETVSGATIAHRDVRGRIVSGEIALYPVEWAGGDKLIYNVIDNASYEALQYSLDGVTWIDSTNFPFDFIYKERTNEIGTFSYALTNYLDRIPIFEDEETAQGYIDGDIPISAALNWNEISNDYPGEDLPLDIGDPDDGTDWGDVYTQNFFANTYLCPTGALREIANRLYDTTPAVWEAIKTGLEMFGNNPIESVISLIYYPLSLDSVFTQTTTTSNIWFGGYNFDNMQNSVKQVVYPNGYFYCGGVDFNEDNLYGKGNWKNYKSCRIFVDLPYCGRYELDPAKYWGKHINVIYYIDLTTGGCIACLVDGPAEATRNGKCLDQFNGIIGTKLSMTLTDFASYANAQINTLLGAGGQSVNNGISVGESGASAFAAGNALGMVGAAGSAAALGAIQGAKTVYGLTMNNINKFNQTRGGSTGMLNQYANQKPTFIFIYPDTDNPSNFNKMYGTPSNAGGLVSSFTGYFEADTIKLNISGATESEKEKIRSLLMGGIYIGNRT